MPITPAQYNERREKLTELFNAVADYPELPAETRKSFVRAAEKLRANSFEIVLVGEFQGGKSTTFNAICDGRPISPMGSGVKTSACRISARNIADPNEPERAVVTWKSDAELILTMYDVLERNLPDDERERFANAKDRDFEGISFDNPRDLQLMRDCVEKEWAVYNKRPSVYDPDQSGKLDLLYIASLILEFCSDATIVRERAETKEITIDDARSYVVFPEKWAERWLDGDPKSFTADEIKLAFVGKVDCYLHSPNLERLGCVIVDCPGLFAGPWDTQVATDAMIAADAILYLLRGDKQIGRQELRALQEIRKTKQLHKLFVAINARMSKNCLSEKIRPADAAEINKNFKTSDSEEAGFSVADDEIFIFNALLSYCAKSRGAVEAGSDEEKAWKKKTRNTLGTYLDLDFDDDAETIRELLSDVAKLSSASDYETLMNACESTVVEKKARSLLLDSGSVPVNAALSDLEGKLALREESAEKNAEQVRAELDAAKDALDRFQRRSKEIVEQELNDPTLVSTLGANMIAEVYEQNTGLLADSLMRRIETMLNDDTTQFRYVCHFVKRRVKKFFNAEETTTYERDEFSETLKGCVKEAMDEVCRPASEGWLANVAQGQNAVYQATLGQKTRTLELLLRQEWNEMMVKAPTQARAYLKGLELDGVGRAAVGNVMRDFDGSGLTDTVRSSIFKQFIGDVSASAVAVCSATIAGILALVVLGSVLAWPVALAVAVAAALATGAGIEETIREKIGERVRVGLAEKLEPKLRQTMNRSDVKASLLNLGEETARKIVEFHRVAFQKDLNVQRRKFDNRVAALEEQMKMSIAQQRSIAAEAKRVREEVARLRRPLETFVAETSVYFEEDATL